MTRALNGTDKKILKLADTYVRDVMLRSAKPEPVDWRGYHEAAKRQLVAYARRKAS